jgi:hypothetical protein
VYRQDTVAKSNSRNPKKQKQKKRVEIVCGLLAQASERERGRIKYARGDKAEYTTHGWSQPYIYFHPDIRDNIQ